MLLISLTGVTLLVSVATGPAIEPQGSEALMSVQKRTAAVEALVLSATDCIAQAVAAAARAACGLGR